MTWHEIANGERVILTERPAAHNVAINRRVYVDRSDAADIWVTWGEDEGSVVTLEAEDMDQLCMWWILKGRPDYRAVIREYDQEHSVMRSSDDWIERTPESFDELVKGSADAH